LAGEQREIEKKNRRLVKRGREGGGGEGGREEKKMRGAEQLARDVYLVPRLPLVPW
jgi:hypothetical protein